MIFNYSAYLKDGFRLLGCLTFARIINYFRIIISYRYSLLVRKPFLWSDPFSLSLETSAVCNLRCPECATGTGKSFRIEKLADIHFVTEKLQLHRKNAFYCNLYFQGEPFLHPEIYEMIKESRTNRYYSVISTNGHFLNEKHCKAIIASGLNRLIVSLDGTDSESYSLYRKGGSFNKVIEGIRRLSELKRKTSMSQPLVVVQFLVNKSNEHQMKEASTLIKNLGADVLEFKSMQIYSDEGMNLFKPQGNKYNRYKQKHERKGNGKDCFRLWSHMVYTSDGVVVPCCFDKIPNYSITISANGSSNVWKSPEFMNFRRRVLLAAEMPAICQNCIR
jgi:MoaA/NifB/PqqE/SkfB family radical SAM enzyme